MSRAEFSKSTKLAAFERAGGHCEKCLQRITTGAEYDHIKEDYISKDNSLSNCMCLCKKCHAIKTKASRPAIDKTRAIYEKRAGARKSKGRPMAGTKASGFKKKLDGSVERR